MLLAESSLVKRGTRASARAFFGVLWPSTFKTLISVNMVKSDLRPRFLAPGALGNGSAPDRPRR